MNRKLLPLFAIAALFMAIAAACATARPKPRMVIASPGIYWGIDERLTEELKDEGVKLFAYPECPKIKDILLEKYLGERLMDYNIFIFGDSFYSFGRPDPTTGAIPNEMLDAAKQMKKFLEGGGIWFCGLGEQNWGTTTRTLNYILKELNLDAEVLGEVVMDTAVMKQGTRTGEYAWAEVARDPLTEGVSNVLHPTGVVTSEGSMGVVPIVKMGKAWRVLLRGSKTAASYPLDLTPPTTGDKLAVDSPGTVKSSPILCAVRQIGRGRVVLWPTWTNYTVTGGSYGELFDGERDGKTSDGRQLIKNLLYWLAEPAQGSKTVGLFDPVKYRASIPKQDPDKILRKWCVPGRKDYAGQYKGLVGAHSSLSDGKNTPEEMIAAAKKAGYDFIAFTEDLAKMDEPKWEKLLATCDKLNNEDPHFRAFQGLDFLDEADNRGVVFGHRYWVTKNLRSLKYPDRVEYWYSFAYKSVANPKLWPPRIIIRSRTNNKRPWTQGMWNLFAPYCYEGGKLVDDSFREYRPLTGRYNFEWNTGIAAVHTVRSVEEVKATADPSLYQFHVRADQLSSSRNGEKPQGVYDSIWTNCGPWKPDPETDRVRDYYPHYFPCYPSTGPEIVDFRTKHIGAGHGANMAIPDNNRCMLHILVHADAGLDEVKVFDGERLVRRYLPTGKDFEHFMAVPNNAQHSYTLELTDKAGGRAVSWPAWTHIAEWNHIRCGDNWNYNTHRKAREGKGFEPTYHLLEVTAHWGQMKKEDKPKRPLYNCYQARWCHVGLGATGNYIAPDHQQLRVDDEPWDAAYYAKAILVDLGTAGPYGTIATNRFRHDYREKKPIPYTTGSFAGPYPVVASPWPADLKYYYPLSRWNGATVVRYEGKVSFVRKVSTPDGGPIRIGLGGGDKGNPSILEVMNADGTFKRHEVGKKSITVEIPVGGYVCWYDDQGDGIGGVIALSPGVHLVYGKQWQGLYKYVPSPARPMSEVSWDIVFVSGTPETSNSNEQMLDVWKGMGFAGRPALYEVDPRVGKVVNQRFFLTLQSEQGGFRGRIVRTTPKLLPIHLPVWVKGLNPRWDAGIWYKGNTMLEVIDNYRDPWGMKLAWATEGRYEPRFDEVRYIPVLEDGTGYCQVETDEQDPDVFIGNFLVCDQPEVFLSLRKAEKGTCVFEINNPTDRTLQCIVTPAKGFGLAGTWTRTLTLPPGGFQVVDVTANR